ncbi:MAG: sirohydrochlorin cobaltochelatase [Oscillospiraceae bacterium]
MKKALLVVSFGTSYHDTLEKNITAIENDIATALPGRMLVRAFTSGMIIKKLRERDGVMVLNVSEALEKLLAEGYTDLVMQPTHVLNGDEYDKLCHLAHPFETRFEHFAVGTPLLTDVIDYHEVAKAMLTELPEKRNDTSLVFMGHGTEHHANAVYAMLEYVFHDMGRTDIYIGTVEGYPAFDEILRRLRERKKAQNVVLYPLMVVAGDHAKNDLAGENGDSWKSLLEKEGYRVTCVLRGLGENSGIRKIFVKHAREAE